MRLAVRPRWASLLLVLATGVAGCAGAGPSGSPGKRTLVFGAVVSLTGAASSYGPQQANGIRLAADTINASGGVSGAHVTVLVADDKTDPDIAASVTRELIERDHVLAVLGPTLSASAVTAHPVADRLRTPALAISNTANNIVGNCAYPCDWVWRASLGEATSVPDNIETAVLYSGVRKAAIVYSTADVLGADEADLATATFPHFHVDVTSRLSLPPDASSSWVRDDVSRVLATHPDVVFIGSAFPLFIKSVMRSARDAGFTGMFLGGNALNSYSVQAQLGALGSGARSATPWMADNDFPDNRAFVQSYTRDYRESPDSIAAQAYAGVQILAQAAQRAGLAESSAPVAAQRQAMQRALADVAVMTPLGPFRFTPSHDVDQIVWIAALDGRGRQRLVDFCDPSC